MPRDAGGVIERHVRELEEAVARGDMTEEKCENLILEGSYVNPKDGRTSGSCANGN